MHKHHTSNPVRAALAAALGGVACVGQGLGDGSPPPVIDDREPIADSYLDRSYTDHAGLLTSLAADGQPITDGPTADPMIAEARRFYDTVQYPAAAPTTVSYPDPFTGAANFYRATAPLTLDVWKSVFGFPARASGEDVRTWRSRAGVVVYYNRNELGLGRELGCAQFIDGQDANGDALVGLACFVTNYGAFFDDAEGSLAGAIDGTHPRNTVCITYRPSMDPEYQVQFYAFASDGRRVEWAQLDTLGPRPHPHVCMNCHGGAYDWDRHLAHRARFLPLDPNALVFATDGGPYERGPQEERIRQLNALSLATPLTDAQRAYVNGMYGGAPYQPGQAATAWAPPGWQANAADAALYREVVRPYCGTCHLAIDRTASGDPSPLMRGLSSRDAMAGAAVGPYLCSFQMPNAQPTMAALWQLHGNGDDTGMSSGADRLLRAFAGGGSELCADLPRASDCRRGPDPDALCGDAHSGTACDPDTGRCTTGRTLAVTTDPAQPSGVCRMDGSRGCPSPDECRPASTGLPTYDGACYVCGRAGTLACAQKAACEAGLSVDANGMCTTP